jgi:hypothetical protein
MSERVSRFRVIAGAAVLFCGGVLGAACSSSPSNKSAGGSSSKSTTTTTVASTTAPSTTTTTTSAPAATDSCNVVTEAEAGTALGQTVAAGVMGKATVEGGIACVYYGPSVPAGADPDVPVDNSVRVVLVIGPDATTWFNDYKSKVPAQPIAGLGDQAYYDGTASLSVLKGDDYLRVAVIGAPDTLTAEEGLARAALPNM